MEKICRSALVPFSTKQMYDLVEDIENYKLFVPFCKNSVILDRHIDQVTARLDISKNGISKSFTTNNHSIINQSIKMELVDGPFSFLCGNWSFTPLSETACKIEFQLEFEFKNQLAGLAFSKIFRQLVQSMVSAFSLRAEKIYHSNNE